MSLSLKDQLIAAGLVKADAEKTPTNRAQNQPNRAAKVDVKGPRAAQRTTGQYARPQAPQRAAGHARAQAAPSAAAGQAMSLAHAWQARAHAEDAEKAEQRRVAEEKARLKRERKAKAQAIVAGKALNVKDAEHARHFQYGKKICRIYLTTEQRIELNAGVLGVAQMDGRFVLLPAEIMQQLHDVAPEFVALFGASVEPSAPASEDQYSDDKFKVPDDLSW
jgi:uncharacterized protein YaiL (DUF2058 family)